MNGLPATLVVRPTGFDTLVTRLWRAQESAYFQYAALLLIVISGLSMVAMHSQERMRRSIRRPRGKN